MPSAPPPCWSPQHPGVTATALVPPARRPAHRSPSPPTTTHEALLTISTPETPPATSSSAPTTSTAAPQVGADGASCQIIDVVGPERLRVQCVASLSLPAGQLTAQGLPVVDEAGRDPFTLAITGGTGAYADAHGQVTVHPLDDQRSRYTITLRG